MYETRSHSGAGAASSHAPNAEGSTSSAMQLKQDLRTMSYDEQVKHLTPPDASPPRGQAPIRGEAAPATRALIAELEAERGAAAKELLAIEDEKAALDEALRRAEAKAGTQRGVPAWATNEGVEVEKLKEQKAALDGKQKALEETYTKAASDLGTLESAGSGPGKLHEILARRGKGVISAAETERSVTDSAGNDIAPPDDVVVEDGRMKRIAGTPMDRQTSVTTSQLVDGAAISETDTRGHQVGLGGGAWNKSTTTAATSGDTAGSATESSGGKIDVFGQSLTRNKASASEVTTGGVTSKESTSSTSTYGTGGWTQKKVDNQQVDDHSIKTETNQGVTRKNGELGYNRGSIKTDGKVDEDGELVEGSQSTKKAEAKVTATQDKLGVGGSADADHTKKFGNGAAVKASGHCGGHVSVQVEPDVEKPGMYTLVTVLSLEGSVGVGGSKELGGGKATVGGDVKAYGALSKTWRHSMSEAECQRYREALNGLGPGGAGPYPEFTAIGAAWLHDWKADDVAAILKKLDDDAEAIRRMAKGDSVTNNVKGGVEVNAEAGAEIGGVGIKGNYGHSEERDITTTFTDDGDATTMDVEVVDTSGNKGGGELSFKGVGVGVGIGKKDINGRGVSLSVPKDDPAYVEILEAVKAADTPAEIAALMQKYPQLKASESTTKGVSQSEEVTLSLGKAKASMGNDHGHSHKQTIDQDGKITDRFKGHQQSSESIAYDDMKIGSSTKNSIDITVGPDGEIDGDLQKRTTESDLTGALMKLTDKNTGSPGSKVAGAPKPQIDNVEDVQGMFFNTKDFERVIGEAGDAVSWNRHGVGDMAAWKELGAAIRAAKGDKRQVAKLLSEFMDSDDMDHREMIENTIRPVGTGNGGSAYEFPPGLERLRDRYKALVYKDPVAALKEQQAASIVGPDNADPAVVAAATALDEQLNQLSIDLESKQPEFRDQGRFSEMLRLIGIRRAACAKLMGMNQAQVDGARYNDLLTRCQNYKAAENTLYAKILDNYSGERETDPSGNWQCVKQLKQLYRDYEQSFGTLEQLALKYEKPRQFWEKYRPEKKRLDLHQKGKPPVERTLEEENKEAARQAEADRQSDAAWKRSSWHAEAEAQLGAQKKVDEKAQAVAAAQARVASAKAAAANAAGWHNYANSQGKAVSPEAQAIAGQGWTLWAEVNADYTFHNACRGEYADARAVNAVADKLIARYREVQGLFERGKAANHA